jgi:hypothetical protein
MGLWAQGSGQYLDCTSLANSFAAFDALVHSVIGEGVITGLDFSVVSGAAVQCSVGTAVAGHIVALNVAQNISFAAGTWDVYLCQPVFTYSGTAPIAASYPGANGYDAGVLTAVVSGTKPAALGALLATIVSTGAAISSINNTPTGRVTLPLVSPVGLRTLYPAQSSFTEQPAATPTAVAFTLSQTPIPSASLVIYKNGILIDPSMYTVSGNVVTFPTTFLSTDKLSAGMNY